MASQSGKTKPTDRKTENKAGKFLREVKAELKKVTWPNRQDVIAHTSIVVVVVLLVAAFLGVADAVFAALLNVVIK